MRLSRIAINESVIKKLKKYDVTDHNVVIYSNCPFWTAKHIFHHVESTFQHFDVCQFVKMYTIHHNLGCHPHFFKLPISVHRFTIWKIKTCYRPFRYMTNYLTQFTFLGILIHELLLKLPNPCMSCDFMMPHFMIFHNIYFMA